MTILGTLCNLSGKTDFRFHQGCPYTHVGAKSSKDDMSCSSSRMQAASAYEEELVGNSVTGSVGGGTVVWSVFEGVISGFVLSGTMTAGVVVVVSIGGGIV